MHFLLMLWNILTNKEKICLAHFPAFVLNMTCGININILREFSIHIQCADIGQTVKTTKNIKMEMSKKNIVINA